MDEQQPKTMGGQCKSKFVETSEDGIRTETTNTEVKSPVFNILSASEATSQKVVPWEM